MFQYPPHFYSFLGLFQFPLHDFSTSTLLPTCLTLRSKEKKTCLNSYWDNVEFLTRELTSL